MDILLSLIILIADLPKAIPPPIIVCGSIGQIEGDLKRGYGEELQSEGLVVNRVTIIRIYANLITGTWTLIFMDKNKACIGPAGNYFRLTFPGKET